jgi:hypothetical protein
LKPALLREREMCHGQVSQMDVMGRASNAATMEGCDECHRKNDASTRCQYCHSDKQTRRGCEFCPWDILVDRFCSVCDTSLKHRE